MTILQKIELLTNLINQNIISMGEVRILLFEPFSFHDQTLKYNKITILKVEQING